MKVIKNSNKIFLPQWQQFKPYSIHSSTDVYYLNICNKVFNALQKIENKEIFQKLTLSEVQEMCCFLTCYLEDIISETNIWKAFTTKHFELYNKFVPFQNQDEYFEDEINLDDIQFLIWYFVSSKKDNSLIAPFNRYIVDIVEAIYDVFDDIYDYAPENKALKKWYFLDPNENDYYAVRFYIEKVFLNNYLLNIDVLKTIKNQIDSEFQVKKEENYERTLYAFKDQFLLLKKSKLLALGGSEWAAYVVGKEHKLHNDLLNISKRIEARFLFKNKIDDKYIYIEHIASGKKFNLLKASYDHHNILEKDAILTLGIINWQNEWWFSGISSVSPFDADLILDEKKSIESRQAVSFLEDDKAIKENLKLQNDAFFSYNNNLPVAFLKKKEINNFANNFYDYYNKSLKLSKKEIEEANNRAKKEGLQLGNNGNKIEFDEDFETAIVYFNPNSGIEIYFNICSVLELKSNPYFDKEDFLNDNLGLLLNDFYSTEFANYCYNFNKDKLSFIKIFSGNELDFLLRFFKNNTYKTVPNQTQI